MMKGAGSLKPKCPSWITTVLLVVIGFCLASCAKKTTPVALAEYSTSIVGQWQGTIGSSKETMTIDGDGTFVCQIHPMGFLANTLSQSVPGKVSGTWNIKGAVITLKITGEKHEKLGDRITSSTIESFNADKLTLKSDRGETSSFQRVINLRPAHYQTLKNRNCMNEQTVVRRPGYDSLHSDIDGLDSLRELALDLHWSWNHSTDES